MKRSAFLLALSLAVGVVHAEDGFNLGVGADYSSGDYGTDTTTTIFSVPVTAKYNRGNWTWKASLPWMRVDGDPNVVPGLGSVTNNNPRGRGRGGIVDPTQPESGTASGIGDLRLSATYGLDTGGPLGVDLTANFKVATADEDKGLGTGANDYGVAVDLYRDFNRTLLFGGAGYTRLGASDYIDADSVFNTNVGAAWKAGKASFGAMYDWREAATEASDDRSEVTGFVALPTGDRGKLQLYAVKGLSDGSPDWGVGLNLSAGF
ncbi:transporter [Aerolutibacter ruishenii]|uniref:Outer membrane beta-barrel porin/alpha-amylase n=1 Tax=Aerolutibacter ruishenii TaxID=686800 RepID=A0A562LRM9_9GAMM|nr:transporter [Lysobacter ruishenii]TWI10269.1 hypothetical protein IP93_01847 [Lysobacter ruishenii]